MVHIGPYGAAGHYITLRSDGSRTIEFDDAHTPVIHQQSLYERLMDLMEANGASIDRPHSPYICMYEREDKQNDQVAVDIGQFSDQR